jgi:glucan biosynthesis protein C
LVSEWELPAFLKFTSIVVLTSALLLVTYQYGVRYTAIGRLLNGPRLKAAAQ